MITLSIAMNNITAFIKKNSLIKKLENNYVLLLDNLLLFLLQLLLSSRGRKYIQWAQYMYFLKVFFVNILIGYVYLQGQLATGEWGHQTQYSITWLRHC